ncbi:hypothetical protein CC1G_14757 [Coprinopsis cinerea okayama7|uniref:Uncharacterized protein n=1 Tax=Coprinopsis cinerea (strain Okayama-7 / 130 / ATCC MYA-4618 / FGSC 9003) TaxID=240176 RepID=D6RNM0_COPC7|nr:hypothetical protein CC1G_14757 [Coprinopsis cinerea okayama7\|eukprot:XP_002910779.1 hypothetical protein CC1G_14757 [Coprinopsis cinerea okayama7\
MGDNSSPPKFAGLKRRGIMGDDGPELKRTRSWQPPGPSQPPRIRRASRLTASRAKRRSFFTQRRHSSNVHTQSSNAAQDQESESEIEMHLMVADEQTTEAPPTPSEPFPISSNHLHDAPAGPTSSMKIDVQIQRLTEDGNGGGDSQDEMAEEEVDQSPDTTQDGQNGRMGDGDDDMGEEDVDGDREFVMDELEGDGRRSEGDDGAGDLYEEEVDRVSGIAEHEPEEDWDGGMGEGEDGTRVEDDMGGGDVADYDHRKTSGDDNESAFSGLDIQLAIAPSCLNPCAGLVPNPHPYNDATTHGSHPYLPTHTPTTPFCDSPKAFAGLNSASSSEVLHGSPKAFASMAAQGITANPDQLSNMEGRRGVGGMGEGDADEDGEDTDEPEGNGRLSMSEGDDGAGEDGMEGDVDGEHELSVEDNSAAEHDHRKTSGDDNESAFSGLDIQLAIAPSSLNPCAGLVPNPHPYNDATTHGSHPYLPTHTPTTPFCDSPKAFAGLNSASSSEVLHGSPKAFASMASQDITANPHELSNMEGRRGVRGMGEGDAGEDGEDMDEQDANGDGESVMDGPGGEGRTGEGEDGMDEEDADGDPDSVVDELEGRDGDHESVMDELEGDGGRSEGDDGADDMDEEEVDKVLVIAEHELEGDRDGRMSEGEDGMGGGDVAEHDHRETSGDDNESAFSGLDVQLSMPHRASTTSAGFVAHPHAPSNVMMSDYHPPSRTVHDFTNALTQAARGGPIESLQVTNAPTILSTTPGDVKMNDDLPFNMGSPDRKPAGSATGVNFCPTSTPNQQVSVDHEMGNECDKTSHGMCQICQDRVRRLYLMSNETDIVLVRNLAANTTFTFSQPHSSRTIPYGNHLPRRFDSNVFDVSLRSSSNAFEGLDKSMQVLPTGNGLLSFHSLNTFQTQRSTGASGLRKGLASPDNLFNPSSFNSTLPPSFDKGRDLNRLNKVSPRKPSTGHVPSSSRAAVELRQESSAGSSTVRGLSPSRMLVEPRGRPSFTVRQPSPSGTLPDPPSKPTAPPSPLEQTHTGAFRDLHFMEQVIPNKRSTEHISSLAIESSSRQTPPSALERARIDAFDGLHSMEPVLPKKPPTVHFPSPSRPPVELQRGPSPCPSSSTPVLAASIENPRTDAFSDLGSIQQVAPSRLHSGNMPWAAQSSSSRVRTGASMQRANACTRSRTKSPEVASAPASAFDGLLDAPRAHTFDPPSPSGMRQERPERSQDPFAMELDNREDIFDSEPEEIQYGGEADRDYDSEGTQNFDHEDADDDLADDEGASTQHRPRPTQQPALEQAGALTRSTGQPASQSDAEYDSEQARTLTRPMLTAQRRTNSPYPRPWKGKGRQIDPIDERTPGPSRRPAIRSWKGKEREFNPIDERTPGPSRRPTTRSWKGKEREFNPTDEPTPGTNDQMVDDAERGSNLNSFDHPFVDAVFSSFQGSSKPLTQDDMAQALLALGLIHGRPNGTEPQPQSLKPQLQGEQGQSLPNPSKDPKQKRPRTEDRKYKQKCVRSHALKCMGRRKGTKLSPHPITSVGPQNLERFYRHRNNPSSEYGPDIKNLVLHLDTTAHPTVRKRGAIWNEEAADLFVEDIILEDDYGFTDDDKPELREIFLVHIKALEGQYKAFMAADDIVNLEAKASVARRRYRFERRLQVCLYFEDEDEAFKKLSQLFSTFRFNWECCSGDESEGPGPNRPRYKRRAITTLPWRAQWLREVMDVLDKLHLVLRFPDGVHATPGRFPTPRFDPAALDPSRKIEETVYAAPRHGLPGNFYDEVWLREENFQSQRKALGRDNDVIIEISPYVKRLVIFARLQIIQF